MVIAIHSDAAYLNVGKSRSRDGAHIMLSEDTPVPTINIHVLTFAQIIKFVMSSVAKAEFAGLFICSKAMFQLHQTLIDMGWPQPKYPIKCDNSTSVGVANYTIIQCKTKTMNMQYHWLCCREAQGQFRFFGLLVPKILPIIAQKITPPFIMRPIGLPMQGNHSIFVNCKDV